MILKLYRVSFRYDSVDRSDRFSIMIMMTDLNRVEELNERMRYARSIRFALVPSNKE